MINNVDFDAYSKRKYYYKSERYSSYYNDRYYARDNDADLKKKRR